MSGLESGDLGPGSKLPFNSFVTLGKLHNSSDFSHQYMGGGEEGLDSVASAISHLYTAPIRPLYGGKPMMAFSSG